MGVDFGVCYGYGEHEITEMVMVKVTVMVVAIMKVPVFDVLLKMV